MLPLAHQQLEPATNRLEHSQHHIHLPDISVKQPKQHSPDFSRVEHFNQADQSLGGAPAGMATLTMPSPVPAAATSRRKLEELLQVKDVEEEEDKRGEENEEVKE
jgi:hypothetical protein